MKKILVVTGTRADYGIYYPILKAIEQDWEMDLRLLVTGMHLSPQYGNTVKHIENDGFQISAKVDCLLQGSTHANMAKAIGLAIMGMTPVMEDVAPDCVIVLGDRGEMLAASIVSAHLNIPLVHVHGGEVSGTIDESVRHAISKLAHIHLAATEESRNRLIRLGEDPWRIHVVGAPRIETIQSSVFPQIDIVKEKYKLKFNDDYLLFAYHPVTTNLEEIQQLQEMLSVLLDTDMNIVCILPNADAGSDLVLNAYRVFETDEKMHFVKSFEQLDYLSILQNAKLMVGNSSSGIIEAASFHIPVVNIGSRQDRRERSANIIDIATNARDLKQALANALTEKFLKKVTMTDNVYGKGNTSKLVVEILKGIAASKELIQKTITY